MSNVAKFNKFEFIDYLIDSGWVSLESHVMHDGEITPYYIDFRGFSDNKLIDNVVENVFQLVYTEIQKIGDKIRLEKFSGSESNVKKLEEQRNRLYDIEAYIGVPEGMTSVGVSLSRKYGKKVVIARSKEKEIADSFNKKWFIGLEEGDKVIVLEDVIQTGDMTHELIKRLIESKANVLAFGALVDRRENPHLNIIREYPQIRGYSASDALAKIFQIPFFKFTDIHFLLDRYDKRKRMSKEKMMECINFYAKHGADLYNYSIEGRQMSKLEDILRFAGGGVATINQYDEDWREREKELKQLTLFK
ncbi:hypothetical protein HZA33_00580 [Candidatus Pacearchaeota archaeon]|nr:hypothetical protein [Candidatus Pacearchaeota archaeon]